MPQISDVTAVAIVTLAALACGLLFARLRQPAIIGYIAAGVVLGPAGLKLINNRDAVSTLAEFGVLMLLFLIGMQLDLRRFVSGWRTAIGTAVIQIAGSVGVALLLAPLLGWKIGPAVLLGFAVSVSSTAVGIKLIESSEGVSSRVGRTAIGVLIAQDMAVVPMMLVLGALAKSGLAVQDLIKIGLSVLFLVALFWLLLRRPVRLPFAGTITGHHDLSPLTGLAWCFGAATAAELAGLSAAYGAFLAGVVIGNSSERQSMLASSQPIESVLMVVFFLSVGLLLDPAFIWANLGTVFLLLAMVTLFKTALNILALRLLGEAWPHAFLTGVILAQIGEFSFLLANLGKTQKLIGANDARLVVAVTVLSLMLSPLWLMAARRIRHLAADGAVSPVQILAAFGLFRLADPFRRQPMEPVGIPAETAFSAADSAAHHPSPPLAKMEP